MNTTLPASVPVIQTEKIARILARAAKQDTLIAGDLLALPAYEPGTAKACKSAGKCAIGELLFAAGVPGKKILEGGETSPGSSLAKVLEREYGLLPIHTEAVEEVNDACGDGEERYQEVAALVEFADAMQSQGVRFRSVGGLKTAFRSGEFY